ncbi:MAG: hypothetical protein K2X54_24695, partial [Methylobacterium organophilum]|nr:hypothetical protein [Methylobacterium organophilum]
MAEASKPPCESGRTMRIMLSPAMQDLVRVAPRTVIVDHVPWELFEEQSAQATCERNHRQTIERISERGGFDAREAVCVLTGMGPGAVMLLQEGHAHRILYQMVHLFRRGVLTGGRSMQTVDDGSKILAGLEDALAYAQGDTSRAKLITVKDGQIVDAQDAAPPGPWRPQLAGADRLGRDRKGDVTINVPTALCWLQFRPDSFTGTEDETRPGVGFTLVAYPGSAGEWPNGVIPRDEAFRLYEMLARFFAAHPPSGEPAAQELEAAAAGAAPVQADRLRRIAA